MKTFKKVVIHWEETPIMNTLAAIVRIRILAQLVNQIMSAQMKLSINDSIKKKKF
jgi:hypothetical protein